MATRFVLGNHPDPYPDLPVEQGPSDEGVGWWVPQVKHTNLAKYIGGTRAAQAKWPSRVLIDPFCGPGRIRVRGETDTRDGGSIVAWRQSVASGAPFTRVFIGDISESRLRACEQRLTAVGAPVTAFVGPASETTPQMVALVPPRSLCPAYVDPYNLEFLAFPIIEALAKLPKVDFAVHFSLMDLSRNVDMELDPERDRFDDAAPGWRECINASVGAKQQVARAFFDYWMALVASLGFTVSREMPLIRDDGGRPLYRLVFFSRHAFPNKIWDDIAKSPNLQFDF